MNRLERAALGLGELCRPGLPERVVLCVEPGPPGRRQTFFQGPFTRDARVAERLTAAGLDARQLRWLDGWPEGVEVEVRLDQVSAGSEPEAGAQAAEDLLRTALTALTEGRNLSEEAVVTVTRRLKEIVGVAREHGEAIVEVAGDYEKSRADGPSLVATVTALGETLQTFRTSLTEELHNHAHLVKGAVKSMDALHELTDAISRFAEESRMATFNARIEAARVGSQGLGFVAIANSLQDLVKDLKRANRNASTVARQLSAGLPHVAESTASLSSTVSTQLKAMAVSVSGVKLRIAANLSAAERQLERVTRRASALEEQSSKALSDLQFQDRTSQLMQTAQQAIEGALEGLDAAETAELLRRKESLADVKVARAEAGSIELF